MPSSSASRRRGERGRTRFPGVLALAAPAVILFAPGVQAEQPAQGFAVERFYPSAAGSGWLVMDDLDMQGGLGGAARLTVGYANNPLVVGSGPGRVAVVADQLGADLGGAVTYHRWRLYLDLAMPLLSTGQGGTVDGYTFTPPAVNPGSEPDTVSDVSIGSEVRMAGEPGGPLRLGADARLYLPNGRRADYDSDGTFRAMLRALVAGDVGRLAYAGQLGVHIRPLDDSSTPGSPRGSELVFGLAAGSRLPVGAYSSWALVVGPELFGATALRSWFSADDTAIEGLMSGRIEITRADQMRVGIGLGAGGGLDRHFGAPDWRLVVGVDVRGCASCGHR